MKSTNYVIPYESIWHAAQALVEKHGDWATDVASAILDDPELDGETQYAWEMVYETVVELTEKQTKAAPVIH